jgi:hypothetical protein
MFKDHNVSIRGFEERKNNCHEGQQQIGRLSKHHMEKTFITLENYFKEEKEVVQRFNL